MNVIGSRPDGWWRDRRGAIEVLVDRLAQLLGPQMARSTVNTFCKRTVGVAPEALSASQLALVLPSLKPMLSTLIGTTHADTLITTLSQELSR